MASVITGVICMIMYFIQWRKDRLLEEPGNPTNYPLVFNSWVAYVIVLIAALINVVSQNLMTISN